MLILPKLYLTKLRKSLQRMLSAKGNPTMDDLTIIYKILCQQLNVSIKIDVVSGSDEYMMLNPV